MYFSRVNFLIFFSSFILILFFQINTPLISDDWFFINNPNYFISNRPLSTLFVTYAYPFSKYDLFNINFFVFIKSFYILICIISFYYILINLNISKYKSLYLSFIIIFYPLHDSATYWIWSISHLLSFTIALVAFLKLRKNKLLIGIFLKIFCLLLSYSCLPVIFTAILYFFIIKKFKIFFSLILVFLFYFFYLILITDLGNLPRVGIGYESFTSKLSNILDLKNIIFHMFSLLDILTISHLVKIMVSFDFNWVLLFSFILSFFITFAFTTNENKNVNKSAYIKFLLFLLVILIFSLFLFIISTKFPYIPFGLGNRVNIYISPFVVLLFIFLTDYLKNVILRLAIIFVFNLFIISSIFSINIYWKNLNETINIVHNKLNKIATDETVLLTNFKYVKYHDFNHIELLNNNFYLENFLQSHSLKRNNIIILNKKNYNKINLEEKHILYNIYDLKNNMIYKKQNIQQVYYYLSHENIGSRHWAGFIFKYEKFKNMLPDYYSDKF